jgi:hypothetical protein
MASLPARTTKARVPTSHSRRRWPTPAFARDEDGTACAPVPASRAGRELPASRHRPIARRFSAPRRRALHHSGRMPRRILSAGHLLESKRVERAIQRQSGESGSHSRERCRRAGCGSSQASSRRQSVLRSIQVPGGAPPLASRTGEALPRFLSPEPILPLVRYDCCYCHNTHRPAATRPLERSRQSRSQRLANGSGFHRICGLGNYSWRATRSA